MKKFINNTLCSKCKGRCCKNFPGINFPSDFGLPKKKRLIEVLKSGRYCIDSWEGDPRYIKGNSKYDEVHFVRPAIKGRENKIYDPTWIKGECTFLTSNGCSLEFYDRPKGCRLLQPRKGKCITFGGKIRSVILWIPYYNFLYNLIYVD